ncbi:DUF3631 domain-containing protein [Mesorhizobium sp. IMUNJ 23033]|uniref:DUF3631 domain-containing protein n=1 Tax=Mesorhizobium sp. IMUNJ 23033 TaxID=3378039 RepID=UPI0038500A88
MLFGLSRPERARVAVVALSKESTPSLGVRLLFNIKTVFSDNDVLATESILPRLCNLDDSPWSDIRGKPIDDRHLPQKLRPYATSAQPRRPNESAQKVFVSEISTERDSPGTAAILSQPVRGRVCFSQPGQRFFDFLSRRVCALDVPDNLPPQLREHFSAIYVPVSRSFKVEGRKPHGDDSN